MSKSLSEFSNFPVEFPTRTYRGICKEVVDGDTYTILVDLGFYTYNMIRLRLLGVNTSELHGAEKEKGLLTKRRVEELILNKPVKILTYKDRTSFDRWVGALSYWVDGREQDLVSTLLKEGLCTQMNTLKS